MREWQKLEFEYAEKLRESNSKERKKLYNKAYSEVAEKVAESFTSNSPDERTAGTNPKLVKSLSHFLDKSDHVLEVGCGRGYTCLHLSPHVASIVGVDVSKPVLDEASNLLSQKKVNNAKIEQGSALELNNQFKHEQFDACISIDVVEHLHPEDAKKHLEQVFNILKAGGKYIVIMPNRLSGPHDITKTVFPEEKIPLGFHLNESTNKEMVNIMGEIGYHNFESLHRKILPTKHFNFLTLPAQLKIMCENLYEILPESLRHRILNRVITIRLIAYKPK